MHEVFAMLLKNLRKAGEILSENEMPTREQAEAFEAKSDDSESEEIEDSVKEHQSEIASIFANALAVALARVEKLVGEEFETVNEAEKFVRSVFSLLRNKEHATLAQVFRKFERQGGDRTRALYRKSLVKESAEFGFKDLKDIPDHDEDEEWDDNHEKEISDKIDEVRDEIQRLYDIGKDVTAERKRVEGIFERLNRRYNNIQRNKDLKKESKPIEEDWKSKIAGGIIAAMGLLGIADKAHGMSYKDPKAFGSAIEKAFNSDAQSKKVQDKFEVKTASVNKGGAQAIKFLVLQNGKVQGEVNFLGNKSNNASHSVDASVQKDASPLARDYVKTLGTTIQQQMDSALQGE
jgi:hypothetical protein